MWHRLAGGEFGLVPCLCLAVGILFLLYAVGGPALVDRLLPLKQQHDDDLAPDPHWKLPPGYVAASWDPLQVPADDLWEPLEAASRSFVQLLQQQIPLNQLEGFMLAVKVTGAVTGCCLLRCTGIDLAPIAPRTIIHAEQRHQWGPILLHVLRQRAHQTAPWLEAGVPPWRPSQKPLGRGVHQDLVSQFEPLLVATARAEGVPMESAAFISSIAFLAILRDFHAALTLEQSAELFLGGLVAGTQFAPPPLPESVVP